MGCLTEDPSLDWKLDLSEPVFLPYAHESKLADRKKDCRRIMPERMLFVRGGTEACIESTRHLVCTVDW